MRAAYYNRLGPASEVIEIGEMPPPRAGPGEVLVEVRASRINPHDVKKRSGWIAHEAEFPVIPHFDGAGELSWRSRVARPVDGRSAAPGTAAPPAVRVAAASMDHRV